MNKRQAKGLACYLVSGWVQGLLESDVNVTDYDGEILPDGPDRDRVRDALHTLIEELDRRADP